MRADGDESCDWDRHTVCAARFKGAGEPGCGEVTCEPQPPLPRSGFVQPRFD